MLLFPKSLNVLNLLFLTSSMGERFLFSFVPKLNKRYKPSHFDFSPTSSIWLEESLLSASCQPIELKGKPDCTPSLASRGGENREECWNFPGLQQKTEQDCRGNCIHTTGYRPCREPDLAYNWTTVRHGLTLLKANLWEGLNCGGRNYTGFVPSIRDDGWSVLPAGELVPMKFPLPGAHRFS